MERQRLREIALEFKQSGAFSSIANQSQAAQQLLAEPFPNMSAYSAFNTFSLANPIQVVEPPKPIQTKEMSQAYLEAVAASQRIAASKNFTEAFICNNSNDSSSNGPAVSEMDSNSSKLNDKKPIINDFLNNNNNKFSQGMETLVQDHGGRNHVGVALKMIKHLFLACRPFYHRRWMPPNRRLI